MNSVMDENSKILARAAAHITSPEYEALPDSIKAIYSAKEYKWLGDERKRIIDRETMPDEDVTE